MTSVQSTLPVLKYMWYLTDGNSCEYDHIKRKMTIDLSTARPKWRLDGPALSGHLLYSLVIHAYANRYHHHLVR